MLGAFSLRLCVYVFLAALKPDRPAVPLSNLSAYIYGKLGYDLPVGRWVW